MLIFKSYTLERKGQVSWAVFGPDHCGTVNHLHGGAIPIRYQVILTCARDLDSHGFLIDNMLVDQFMETQAQIPSDLSCELLAAKMAEDLLSYIRSIEPTCRVLKMELSLSPEPYWATVRVSYEQ